MNGSVGDWLDSAAGWRAIPALCLAAAVALGIAVLPLTWATLLVIGGIVVLIAFVWPQVGLFLLVPAIPFGSLWQLRLGVMNVGLTEALLALVLAGSLARLVLRRRARIVWPALTVPLFLFWGVLLLSLLAADSLEYSLKEILKWTEVLALYLVVANEVDRRWARLLLVAFLGTGTLAALHGVYQFLFQVGPEAFVLFGRFMRAYGTFDQPNPYGGYLGLILPLALGMVVAVVLPLGRRVGRLWLLGAAGSGTLMFAAMIMSWSRGAWLGFAAAAAIVAIAVVARSGRAAVLAVIIVLLAAYALLAGGLLLVPSSITQRFSDFIPYLGIVDVRGIEITDANFAVLERMAHWSSALAMWTDHPWLGVGIGNYEPAYARYALPLWPLPLGHAHNYYLNIAAEAGVLGLGSYLLLWGAALASAWRAARRAQGWQWGLALGVLGVLVHLSVHNLFDNLFVHGMYLHVAILLGLIPSPARRSTSVSHLDGN